MVSTQDPGGSDSEETVVDPDGGERLTRSLHFASARRPSACAGVREPDVCLLFRGKSGERVAALSSFVPGPEGDRLREGIRGLVTERFAAKLLALAPVFPRSVEFDRFGDDFLSLVWPAIAWRRPKGAEEAARAPGCEFDASFGYPCTERERESERKRLSAAPTRSRSR